MSNVDRTNLVRSAGSEDSIGHSRTQFPTRSAYAATITMESDILLLPSIEPEQDLQHQDESSSSLAPDLVTAESKSLPATPSVPLPPSSTEPGSRSLPATPPPAPDYSEVVDLLMSGQNVLFHGPGGSGKSYVLKSIKTKLEAKGKKVAVVTYGKKAALNFGHGATNIHAYFGLMPDDKAKSGIKAWVDVLAPECLMKMRPDVHGKKSYRTMLQMLRDGRFGKDNKYTKYLLPALENIIETDIICIDEISQVGVKMFKFLNRVCIKYCDTDGYSDFLSDEQIDLLPTFGGKATLHSGDMLQTAPIRDLYPFQCQLWNSLQLNIFIFKNIYRFSDMEWAKLLLRMRRGKNTSADLILLRGMVGRKTNTLPDAFGMMKICNTRREVTAHNDREMGKLAGPGYKLGAYDKVYKMSVNQATEITDWDTALKYINENDSEMGTDRVLMLKAGGRVMIIANDRTTDVANGQVGTIMRFATEKTTVKGEIRDKVITIMVKIDGRPDEVPIVRKIMKKSFNNGTIEIRRSQFPIRGAYAATTQKVQGETLNHGQLDYGKEWMGDGVAYTGFSRTTDPGNIQLDSFNPSCIRANKDALAFVSDIEQWDQEEGHEDSQFAVCYYDEEEEEEYVPSDDEYDD